MRLTIGKDAGFIGQFSQDDLDKLTIFQALRSHPPSPTLPVVTTPCAISVHLLVSSVEAETEPQQKVQLQSVANKQSSKYVRQIV